MTEPRVPNPDINIFVQETVDRAPPLSDAQRDKLALLLNVPRNTEVEHK